MINALAKPPNPWGSCFDSAAHNMQGNKDIESLVMCHGIGIANRPGQEGTRIAHAWLEFDHNGERVALDCIWLIYQRASEYREKLQLQYVVEYPREEFMRLWAQNNFPGPWDVRVKMFTAEALSLSAK